MSMSPGAMMTVSNFFARRQRSQTCRSNGLPAIRWSGFPGNLRELQRAGIIPMALLIRLVDDDRRGVGKILCNPISRTAVRHFIETGPNPNRSDTGMMRAFGVDFFIPD